MSHVMVPSTFHLQVQASPSGESGRCEPVSAKMISQGMGPATTRGCEIGWTLEDNVLINRTIEPFGGASIADTGSSGWT